MDYSDEYTVAVLCNHLNMSKLSMICLVFFSVQF